MKRLLIMACVITAALVAADAAFAQVLIPPGTSPFSPPLPPPPPPPKIEVPVVPKMDAAPRQSYVPAAPAPSFGDRITTCLSDAAGAGLGPSDRAEYSRNCANR
jgi:hypothetical protein